MPAYNHLLGTVDAQVKLCKRDKNEKIQESVGPPRLEDLAAL